MDKKTIIALIVVGAIFLLWPVYMRKIVGVQEPVQQQVSQTAADSLESTPSETYIPTPVDDKRPDMRRTESADLSQVSAIEGRPETVVVETNLYKGKLSSLGGGTIISWKLKEYYKPKTEKDQRDFEENWVELMPEGAEGDLGLILGTDMSRKVFDVESFADRGTQTYLFTYTFENGSKIEREYRFAPDNYAVGMTVRLISMTRGEVGESYIVQWKSGLNNTERSLRDDMYYYQAYALQGKDLLKTKEKGTGLREGTTGWVAVRTKYFVMALIPEESTGKAADLEGRKVTVKAKKPKDNKENNWKAFTARLEMPFRGMSEETTSFKLFLGPMDYPLLKQQGSDLHKIQFGKSILKPISIAFFYVLQFLYDIIKNFGWAIIVFSILIKIVLYPLTRKSFQSMRQMQELQPKIAALKEKHKNDSQKLNQETMKLYKQHGVNPMGGCLPLVFQMPVLIALFTLFRTTIMLRQASFLAISDLSAPDAIFGSGLNLLPILMGISMIIQQKLSTSNPQQKAMAYMMPIFLCFIFYNMSAGLNLYYLMFNLLTIAQELLIKKKK